MRSFRGSTAASSPIMTTMFLVAAAGVLAGGMFFAREIATGSDDDPPEIGMWSDDANDRLLVVLGDQGTDWTDLEVRTSAPAKVRLDGQADALHGTLSPGTGYVPVGEAGEGITGGDAVSLCALGGPGSLEVSLRDRVSNTVIFEQTMAVGMCQAGP